LGDTDNDPETLNHGLTSMLKRVDVAAYQAVYDVVEGNFSGGIESLGLAENGVGYALDEYNEALLSVDLIIAIEDITAQIIAGEIVVPDYREQ
jgi:basic membrane protein A